MTTQTLSSNATLQLISGDEILKLDAVDGGQTVQDTKVIFRSLVGDFKDYKANEKAPATPETLVEVYVLNKSANFAEIYDTMECKRDNMCLTQHQILNFLTKYPNWLDSGNCGTVFLFKINGKIFFARIDFNNTGHLSMRGYLLGNGRMWGASPSARFVLPKLII